MNEKHKKLMLKITGFMKDQTEYESLDFIYCLEYLLATSVVTAEVNFDGILLEEAIGNIRVIYKGTGEAFQAYKILKNMGMSKE
jgi:hypothetical protein